MSIQIYWHKRNFDTQKAERYLKERRIPYQSVDLSKHRLGRKEVELFVRGLSARGILDLTDTKVKSHPVAYTNSTQSIIDYVLDNPRLLRSPIIRCDNKVMAGFDEAGLKELLG
jgi:arsenate reductase